MRDTRGRRLAGRPPTPPGAVARRHGAGRGVCGASGLSWPCPRQRSRQTRGVAAWCARPWCWLPPTRWARAAAPGGAAAVRCGCAGAETAPRRAHCRRARRDHRPTGGGPALPRPGAGRLRHCVTAPVQRGTGGIRPRAPPGGVGPHAAAEASGAARLRSSSRPARAVSGRGTDGGRRHTPPRPGWRQRWRPMPASDTRPSSGAPHAPPPR